MIKWQTWFCYNLDIFAHIRCADHEHRLCNSCLIFENLHYSTPACNSSTSYFIYDEYSVYSIKKINENYLLTGYMKIECGASCFYPNVTAILNNAHIVGSIIHKHAMQQAKKVLYVYYAKPFPIWINTNIFRSTVL